MFDLSILDLSTDTAMPALMGGLGDVSFDIALPFRSALATEIDSGSIGDLISGYGESAMPTALLAGSDMIASQIAMPTFAANVGMPSAEAMMAMSGLENAQPAGSVETIIADALQGGGDGPDIDALLDALPGAGIGANAGTA